MKIAPPASEALVLSLLLLSTAAAAEPSLEGLWFEADNYPASSVLRFEKVGTGWVGRYVKVSPQQRGFGFSVGEVVVRGVLQGDAFDGQVLLKTASSQFSCPNLTVGWVPIKMTFDEPEKLHGSWLQSWVDDSNACALVAQSWQPYRLERLPSSK